MCGRSWQPRRRSSTHPILLRASRTVVFGGAAYEPTLDKLYIAFRSGIPRPRVVDFIGTGRPQYLAGWWSRKYRGEARRKRTSGLKPAELAAIVVLLLSPFVPYVYADSQCRRIHDSLRNVCAATVVVLIGVVALALGGRERGGPKPHACVALLGVCLYLPPKIATTRSQNAAIESLMASSRLLDASVPVVLVNPINVLAFEIRAPDVELARAVFVADSALALKYTGTNGIDLGYERGEPYLNIRVRRLSSTTSLAAARDSIFLGSGRRCRGCRSACKTTGGC